MSRGLTTLWVLIVLSAATLAAHAAAPMKVLFVGNSLTYYNALPSLVTALAANSTPQVSIHADMLAAPGATIRQHIEEGALETVVASGHYDVVVFQELGGFPICDNSWKECAASPAALERAVALMKKSGARVVMLGTYQATMSAETMTAATRATAEHLAIPWFDWAAALKAVAVRDSSIETLIRNDGHPAKAGSWLAAIGLVKLVTGADPPAHMPDKVCAANWINARPSLSISSLAGKQKQPPVNCLQIADSTFQVLRGIP